MKEIWKDIKGYEGTYQVSNTGRIKRVDTQYILHPYKSCGYHRVKLCKKKTRHDFLVHRLIAIAFIPNPNNYPHINHKDEIKDNNKIENLEWCTHKYNVNYGSSTQRRADKQSIQVVQKTKDGEIIKIHKSRRQASRDTGISNGNICQCIHGYRNTAGGYIWTSIKNAI